MLTNSCPPSPFILVLLAILRLFRIDFTFFLDCFDKKSKHWLIDKLESHSSSLLSNYLTLSNSSW